MGKLKIKHHDNFTIIDNTIFKDRTISVKAKGLFATMCSLPDGWDFTVKGLVTLSTDGETAIRSGLVELEEHGYLKRERVYVNGKIADIDYILYEIPIDTKELKVDFPHEENVIQENKAQLSTKEIKDEKNKVDISKDISESDDSTKTTSFLGSAKSKQKPRKQSLYDKCLEKIYDYTDDEKLQNLLREYLSVRLAMKDKPILGVNQWVGMLNKLKTMQNQSEIVQNSLAHGWAMFYEPNRSGFKSKGDVFSEFGTVKSEKRNDDELYGEF